MHRYWFRQTGSLLLLITTIFGFYACGAQTPSQTASKPTPTSGPTPTVAFTPTPTIPDVPSHLVYFTTSDHVQLAGLLYGRGKTIIICSHMFRTNKYIWITSGVAQRLALHNYQVLAYDFRGNGESSGKADTALLDIDLHAAIAYAHQQGATKIILLGASMGGTATLKVAAHEQVTALITLSAPQSLALSVSDEEVKAIGAPKLFINSQDDSYAADTTHMYAIATTPKELHMYQGSAHGTEIFDGDNGSDLMQRILNFIGHYALTS